MFSEQPIVRSAVLDQHAQAVCRSFDAFLQLRRGLLDLAAQRGQPVVLMSYAWWVPDGYTLERFERRELDYAEHKHPIEIWGEPAHVVRALEAHDRVIRELAATRDVRFVDTAAALAPGRAHFDDVCHLTRDGERLLVDSLAAVVGPAFRAH